MNNTNTICPVCTLYLRPGITLKQHLASHPKQKVIDALVRLSGNDGESFKLDDNTPTTTSEPLPSTSSDAVVVNQAWNNNGTSVSNTMQPVQGNHLFIYQQSMSTTAPSTPNVLNINPLTQQYVIPTVFNSQMMPYIYQQQQVIMASNACVPPTGIRALPFEMPSIEGGTIVSEVVEGNENEIKEITEEKEPKDEKLTTTIQIDDVKVNKMPTNEVVIEEIDSDSPEEYQNRSEFVETASSPQSEEVTAPKDNWNLELNKDCQTQTTNNEPPVEELDYPEDRPEFYYVENDDGDIQYNNPNILQPVSEQQQQLDMIGMDNMQVLINDLSSNQIISQVDHFENSQPERPGVLMTIGDVVDNEQRQLEDSMSRESSNVNIRTDERMPARGELSGQESIGGSSDITWNRIQYHEGSSGMSASYDLLARESWEASDSSSDMEMPNQIAEDNKEIDETAPSVVSFSGPPLNYKCPSCDEAFSNFKERRDHEIEHHPEKVIRNALIGSGIGKKKVKKLTIKLKTDKSEKPETSENNFDNVFTNKLKLENMKTEQSENQTTPEPVDQVKVDENGMPIELKTVCSICDCVVANIRALKLHKFQVHNITSDIRHKCNTCGEGFRNEFKYTQHLKIHPLECRLCGKLFFRRQNIQLHMKRHLGLKPYKCDLCNKAFVTKQKHDEHRNSHTGESPIKCTLCDETFRRHSNLVQHRNRHHLNIKKNVKDYICFCGEVFHSKKKLAWHKEIHDPKPKSCTQCTEKFVHMSSLTRHMRRAHNEKFLPSENRVTENVQCPICKGTYLRSSLDAHIRNHSGVRPYTCLICNKDFTTKWNLKLHKWTHASRTSKPFKCDQCKGAFIRESDYIAHMNSHKSVRPYTCNYCGAQFIRKYNCLRHVKEHENGKTFNCQVCGKSFHRSYYLKDHMRVHSGIRPYACHICGKTSTTKSNHNKHVQIHHAREPVSTEN